MGLIVGGQGESSVAEFAAEIGRAGPVAVAGAGTRWFVGGAPSPGTRMVHPPSGVVDFRPEEMTVRVLAGTPVKQLHAVLGAAGQRTALPDRGGTVGGTLSVGENDLCVGSLGRVRHAVLQLVYVGASGEVVTAGAPTVKNVSGFDVPRLLVGSLGTLGLVAQVVLRTHPLPETSAWLVTDGANPFAVADIVYRPAVCLWDGERTWLRLEGCRVDVDEAISAIGRVAQWEKVDGPPPLPPNRWSLLPSELRHLDGSTAGNFIASVGVGTVFASRPQRRPPLPLPVVALGRRVKLAFDPSGRLNPGRNPMGRSTWS